MVVGDGHWEKNINEDFEARNENGARKKGENSIKNGGKEHKIASLSIKLYKYFTPTAASLHARPVKK